MSGDPVSDLLNASGATVGNFVSFLRNFSHHAADLNAVVQKTKVLFDVINRKQLVTIGMKADSAKTTFLASKLEAQMVELTTYLQGIMGVAAEKDATKKSTLMKAIATDIPKQTEYIRQLCDGIFDTCGELVDSLDEDRDKELKQQRALAYALGIIKIDDLPPEEAAILAKTKTQGVVRSMPSLYDDPLKSPGPMRGAPGEGNGAVDLRSLLQDDEKKESVKEIIATPEEKDLLKDITSFVSWNNELLPT